MRPSHLEIFLCRARRQWTVRLVVEHAAVGLLFGCAAALPLILVLLYRGADARSIAIMLPLLGVTAGAMAGFHRRRTALAAAMLADARLGTSDLLGTAWMLRSSTDPWHATVFALADTYCRDLSPAVIVPRQLSSRAWAGVALAAGGVLTLGLLSGTAPLTSAQPVTGFSAANMAIDTAPVMTAPPAAMRPRFAPSREAKVEQTPDSRSLRGDDETEKAVNATPRGVANTPRPSNTANDGAGDGSARTRISAGRLPTDPAVSHSRPPVSGGALSDGVGTRRAQPLVAGETSFGPVSSSDLSPAPPWSSVDWPADRAAALEGVRSGQIPNTYREMVRDYFDHK